jgi:hypothetical protein
VTDDEGQAFATRAVHGAGGPDPATGAVVPPISLATTFRQEAVGKHLGYEYSRSGNPTRAALERHLASLEEAEHGFASHRAWLPRTRSCACYRPATTSCCPTTPMAAPSASPCRSTRRPASWSTRST